MHWATARPDQPTDRGPIATTAAHDSGSGIDLSDLGTRDLLVVPAHVVDTSTFTPTERERARLSGSTIVVVTASRGSAAVRRAERTMAGTVTAPH